jgi:hypothetical protein
MFRRGQSFPAGLSPSSLASGDFNGDGKLDLVVTDSGNASVNMLLGNGNGTFQSPISYAAGPAPRAVLVADFNQDGLLDVALANNLPAGLVSVLLGNGNGAFQAPLSYVAGGAVAALAVADFNADGFPDIAAANQGGIAILYNAADWSPAPIGDGPGLTRAGQLLVNEPRPSTVLSENDANPPSPLMDQIRHRESHAMITEQIKRPLTSLTRLPKVVAAADHFFIVPWDTAGDANDAVTFSGRTLS